MGAILCIFWPHDSIKNQIYQCYIDFFGEIESWGLPDNWIDNMYDKRNEIVHGGEDTTLEAINLVSEKVQLLEQMAKSLIDHIIDSKYNRQEFIHFDF
ncbi:hypothetical protein Cpap_3265 [Ruminiclostridium papyrosolvens DSM 2782]|uniref:RiboL-PSP-HEPN domain-containing protein n=1 Tax=Ruminiclostridium papyrosolvens DSM 2782 TaxID=588581 RepID=F1TA99_9FIRM|nr:hypothetical protein [Ruminiclostridium papyrosolvens]EGD48841.1 hypothetical protein Cpap_3265 [Ruminiclostridium papyrosolvens DSM 2782]WES32406.1 hypothetical protein P0092_11580 [Ruminiclostridium papyrosolvens DSM 2782]